MNTTLLDAALSYAARGWHVFPLAPRSKAPATSHGFKDATTDEAQIRAWWGARPDCNIGIRTGRESGVWVLDQDPRNGGVASLFELQRRIGKWSTVECVTGWGGSHYYFAWDDSRPVGCQTGDKKGLPPGLDVKGEGGYVVAPPSIHPDTGRAYEWELSSHPDDVAVAPAPLAVLEMAYAATTGANADGTRKAAFDAPDDTTIYGEGQRDNALTSLAGRLRGQGFGLSDLLTALSAYNEAHCRPPLPRSDVERIAGSAAKWEAGRPIKEQRAERAAAKAGPAPSVDELSDEETDERATLRLIARDGHRLRYCAELSRWYVWDGIIWRPDRALTAESIAREAARAHTTAIVARGADVKRIRAALAMEGRNHILASLKGAASDPSIAVLPEQLDCEPDIIATPSGWVDLTTGALMQPDHARLVTQVTATPYDPIATCPRWDRFLAEVATDRADLVEYLRRWVGYCLTGRTKEQCMVVAYGRGANGKGTLWDTLRKHVFGPQYSCEAPPKLLLAQNYDAHPTELMELYRRRLVTASEVPDEARWDEGKLKRLTGEDAVKGRYMRADWIEFNPTHKLVAYFNERPEVRDTTQSFWRRMKLVPFDASFLGQAADDDLRDTLAAEAKGILAWAVRGAVDWYAHGLPESRAVSDATQSYRGTEDTVGAWLADFTNDPMAVGFQTSATLFDDFERWCRKNGSDDRELSKKAFGKQLRIHGAREARSESARGWDLTGCRQALRLTRLTDCSDAETECVRKNSNDSASLQTPDTSDATHPVGATCARMEVRTATVASDASCVRNSPDGYIDDDTGDPWGQGWRT